MANSLPTSGTLSIYQIAALFGGTAPHALGEYYRQNGYVPNISANNNIPTAGTIRISNFYGATLLDPVSALNLWWNNRASLVKSFGNTYSGDDSYRNSANWGLYHSTYPVVDNRSGGSGGGE
jgi:hypothetical protein